MGNLCKRGSVSDWSKRHKSPYLYNSKLVLDGTVDLVKKLKDEGKSYGQIGKIIGKSRQQVSQIYYKSIAK